MNRAHFMAQLRDGLSGLHYTDISDIVADYERHFADGAADGRSEDEVAAALGDPQRLARELRAEAGFKRWEENRSAGNFLGVVLALLGLATIDFVFLLPFLCALAAIFFALSVACLGCIVGGSYLLFNLLPFGWDTAMGNPAGPGADRHRPDHRRGGRRRAAAVADGDHRQAADPLCAAALPPVRFRQRFALKETKNGSQARHRRHRRHHHLRRLPRRRRRPGRARLRPRFHLWRRLRRSVRRRPAALRSRAAASSPAATWTGTAATMSASPFPARPPTRRAPMTGCMSAAIRAWCRMCACATAGWSWIAAAGETAQI